MTKLTTGPGQGVNQQALAGAAQIMMLGSAVVDINKRISHFPEEGQLETIQGIERHLGGCVNNTGLSLKRFYPELEVIPCTCIGSDGEGQMILEEYRAHGLPLDQVTVTDEVNTGFTEVYTVEATGNRTFFSYGGSCHHLSPRLLDWERIKDLDWLHAGYIFLMGEYDQPDPDYGTVLAQTLAQVQSLGVKTSLDLITKPHEDYPRYVHPVLPYVDAIITNELEAGYVTGLTVDTQDPASVRAALTRLFELGVQDLAVIHSPEGGWVMEASGGIYHSPAFELPAGYITSSVGAGDAFCAGLLGSLIFSQPLELALYHANLCAAMSMRTLDPSSGVVDLVQASNFVERYGITQAKESSYES